VPSVSVSALVTGARLYADERPGGAAAFLTDAEVTSVVRRSVAKLRSVLIAERGPEMFAATSTYSTSAGKKAYPLPSTHEATLRVTLSEPSGAEYDLRTHEVGEATEIEQWSRGDAVRYYRIANSTIEITPTPTAAGTVTHYYTTTTDTSATSYDLLVDGWDEWVMLDVAVRLLQIQGLPHTWLRDDRDQLTEQLKRQAQDRVVEDAVRIRDARPDVRYMRW